jgi:hypothetical protein
MGLRDRLRKRIVIKVSNSFSSDGFVSRVSHHLPLSDKKCKSGYNIFVTPLSDGILASIDRERFRIAVDTDGRLILTRDDFKAQLVLDYQSGFATGILGGILYDTFPIPKQELTDYHG